MTTNSKYHPKVNKCIEILTQQKFTISKAYPPEILKHLASRGYAVRPSFLWTHFEHTFYIIYKSFLVFLILSILVYTDDTMNPFYLMSGYLLSTPIGGYIQKKFFSDKEKNIFNIDWENL